MLRRPPPLEPRSRKCAGPPPASCFCNESASRIATSRSQFADVLKRKNRLVDGCVHYPRPFDHGKSVIPTYTSWWLKKQFHNAGSISSNTLDNRTTQQNLAISGRPANKALDEVELAIFDRSSRSGRSWITCGELTLWP